MSRYVLGLREPGAQTDLAKLCSTAKEAIIAVERWRTDQGTITVILRAGKPIDEATLHKDVRADERRSRQAAIRR